MNKKIEKKRISSFDICMNYTYDEDYECYTCEVDLMRMRWPISCRIPTITARIFRWGMSIRLCVSRCSAASADRYKRTADSMIKDLSVKL